MHVCNTDFSKGKTNSQYNKNQQYWILLKKKYDVYVHVVAQKFGSGTGLNSDCNEISIKDK
ncbi:hypothetical protein FORC36_1184 [Vibrio vulnificus]|nr:hypothetical protein VVMO6_01778 [Vibrio vulnificus MO6-24/O]ARN65701.1 hypothetical protein FORC36_1184 [Vibrio vulnificus]ASC56891.1 hypothetical protein FORC37_1197 [Vibrio vulnificus]